MVTLLSPTKRSHFWNFERKKKENDEKKIIYDPVTAKVAGKKQNW